MPTDKERYDKIPHDVAELLINTHPLNRPEKNEESGQEPMETTKRRPVKKGVFDKLRNMNFEKMSNADDEIDIFVEDEDEPIRGEPEINRSFDEYEEYDEYEDYEEHGKSGARHKARQPEFRAGIMVIVFTLVISISVIGLLVYKNNALNKKNLLYEEQVKRIEKENLQLSGIKERNTMLENENASLKREIESLSTNETPVIASESGNSGESESQTLPTVYTVSKGDTLSKISKKFYNSDKYVDKIVAANNIKKPNEIRVGTKITIPSLN